MAPVDVGRMNPTPTESARRALNLLFRICVLKEYNVKDRDRYN